MTDKTSLVNGYRVNVVSATALPLEENYSRCLVRLDGTTTITATPGSKWFPLQEARMLEDRRKY